MIKIARKGWSVPRPYWILIAAWVLFTSCAVARIGQPIAQDELWWLVAAKTLISTGIPQQYADPGRMAVFSPHLYLHSLVSAFRLFGGSEAIARFPGIVSGWISIALIFFIVRSCAKGDGAGSMEWAAWTAFSYAAIPAVVQGAAIIDIDMTLLIPPILLLFWFTFEYLRSPRLLWGVWIGLALCLALWVRVTTPVILTIYLLMYSFVARISLRQRLAYMGAILMGILLFAVSWYGYCHYAHVPFAEPFRYTLQAFWGKSIKQDSAGLSQLVRSLFFFTLWIGIPLTILFVGISVQRGSEVIKRRTLHPTDLFLFGGLVLIVGYTLVGGASFGYPKYQMPAISLLLVYIGLLGTRLGEGIGGKGYGWVWAIGSILVLAQYFLIGDLLYSFKYAMREALAYDLPSYGRIFGMAILKGTLLMILAAVLYGLGKKRISSGHTLPLLLVISLGVNMGMTLRQSTADYHTGYNYGGRRTIETADYIRMIVPLDGVVIGPSEVIYYLNRPSSPYVSNTLWADAAKLGSILDRRTTAVLAYSISTNTVEQVRTILKDESIQGILKQDYQRSGLGSYQIWIRKDLLSNTGKGETATEGRRK